MKNEDDHYSDAELAQRRDEALRRALNTPPMLKKNVAKKPDKKKRTT